MTRLVLILAACFCAGTISAQELRFSEIFGSGMVLQRETEIELRGVCAPGESVSVSTSWLSGKLRTYAGEDGRWSVSMQTPEASFEPQSIAAKSGRETAVLEDVLIGDVWFVGGQSNMQMNFRGNPDQPVNRAQEILLDAPNPSIRLFRVNNSWSLEPSDEMATDSGWTYADPENIKEFSVAGYVFGLRIQRILDIPIGLVQSAHGGSTAEAWIDRETLEEFGEFDLDLDALVLISELDTAGRTVSVSAYSQKPLSVDMKEAISGNVNNAVEEYRLASYDIKGLKKILEEVRVDIPVSTYTMDDSGQEKITSSEVYMIISLVLSVIIYMFIAMFSAMVMQSVIEEKSTRVVEVLISSVNSLELMFGKIIGVAAVALTQFFLWIVLTAVIVLGVSPFIGMDTITASATIQGDQMTQMAEGLGVDPSMMGPAGMTSGTEMLSVTSDSELSTIMATLAGLNYGEILLSFIIYFVLGYLLYASLFAAIGSAVENEADTQQLQMPVTIPLLLAFFIAFYAFKAPDSQVVFWGSIIPFTSPIVMLARIPFGVPFWELALSIGLLLVTFVAMAYVSAKIYKVGILMYGKKTTFRDLYKWLKQK